jgi:DNA excision repair protein ERCC-3
VSGGPLIVQSDKTLLLEVDHPDAQACRMAIAPFAELERSPEHVHTYRLTPLGLIKFSRYPVPHALLVDVAETMDRYGRLQLINDPGHGLVLRGLDKIVLIEVAKSKKLAGMLGARIDDETIAVHASERGRLKQALPGSSRPCSSWAGRPRTWPVTWTARRTRSRWPSSTETARGYGPCGPISRRRWTASGRAARGS